MFRFILFFGISLTFKYFPIFIFIPMLLLMEKHPVKIMRNMLFVLTPMALEILLYVKSAGFRTGVFGFGVANRIYDAGFLLAPGHFTLNIFVIVWVLICGYSYLKDTENHDEFCRWLLYIPLIVSSILFSLILWHPQWVLFITPFLAITTAYHKRYDFFLLVDLLMMGAFVAFTVNFWPRNVDGALFLVGVLGQVNPEVYNLDTSLLMKHLYMRLPLGVYWSLFVGCLMLHALLKYPGSRRAAWVIGKSFEAFRYMPVFNRMCFFVGVMLFIVPAIISLVAPSKEHLKLLFQMLLG